MQTIIIRQKELHYLLTVAHYKESWLKVFEASHTSEYSQVAPRLNLLEYDKIILTYFGKITVEENNSRLCKAGVKFKLVRKHDIKCLRKFTVRPRTSDFSHFQQNSGKVL